MSATKEAHQIDQAYTGFKPFDEWQSVAIDVKRWAALRSRIDALTNADDALLERARRIARRAAAFESGAVEELYASDRGITMTIATEAAEWEQAVNKTGQSGIVHDQLDAYEGLLDLATQRVPITEAGIRELHKRLCRSQETYLVHTPGGPQQQQFRHGEYKTHANHVRKADGTYHAYAPVDMVAPEMERLCSELRQEEFSAAHAVLQAAYIHHALTTIHPFADGNGRVARAIASIFLYRDARIPFLFFVDQQDDYFEDLSAADKGRYERWVEFVSEAGLQTMLLVEQTFQSARAPDVTESLKSIKELYVTKSGYTHDEIDAGAHRLLELVNQAFKKRLSKTLEGSGIAFSHGLDKHSAAGAPAGYRQLLMGPRHAQANVVNERPPAQAKCVIHLTVLVPRDAGTGDSVLLFGHPQDAVVFEARIDELIPKVATSLEIRTRALVEGLVAGLVAQLASQARDAAAKV